MRSAPGRRSATGWVRVTVIAVSLVASLTACPSEDVPPPEAPAARTDKGPPALASDAYRFRLPLLPGWTEVSPSVASAPVVPVAAARRLNTKGLSLAVAPRIEVTSEPTLAAEAESAFRMVKADVESLGQRPGVKVLRSSLGFRPVGPELVGDLDLRYRVGGAKGREVRQRSLLVYQTSASGAGRILSFTASFLARDLDKIAPEVQQMFAMLQLLPPPDGGLVP